MLKSNRTNKLQTVKMSDTPNENHKTKRSSEPSEEQKTENNVVNTCAGGMTEEQARKLKEDLDRAKEESNFSSKSRCSMM